MEPTQTAETDLDEPAEVLDSLPLDAMCFSDLEQLTSVQPWPLDKWKYHYPYWYEPNILAWENLVNCYTMMADSILTRAAPFPGDKLFHIPDLRPELWFYILHDTETPNYILNDWLTCSRTEIVWHVIENPTFDISYWYVEILSEMIGLTKRILHH